MPRMTGTGGRMSTGAATPTDPMATPAPAASDAGVAGGRISANPTTPTPPATPTISTGNVTGNSQQGMTPQGGTNNGVTTPNPLTTPAPGGAAVNSQDPNSVADYYKNQYSQAGSVQAAANGGTPTAQNPTGATQQAPMFGPGAFNAPGGYNPTNYATLDTANKMQGMYGGTVDQANSGGPFANANAPQYNVSQNGMQFNAGMMANMVNLYGPEQAARMHQAELAQNPGGGQTFASGAGNFSEVGHPNIAASTDTGGQDYAGAHAYSANQEAIRNGSGGPMQQPAQGGYGMQQPGGYAMPQQPRGTQYGGYNSWGNPGQGNPFATMQTGQQQYDPGMSVGFPGSDMSGGPGNPMSTGSGMNMSQLAQILNRMGYGFGGGGGGQSMGPVAWGQQANQGNFYPSFY